MLHAAHSTIRFVLFELIKNRTQVVGKLLGFPTSKTLTYKYPTHGMFYPPIWEGLYLSILKCSGLALVPRSLAVWAIG